ncbi:MAG: DinB family protein [Thermoplasmata archaeon]
MESELEVIRSWFAYIADARRDYLETFSKLPIAELSRDQGASFPTLLDIFGHSQGALYFWMKDCARFEFPPQEPDTSTPPSLADVRKDENYIQSQIRRIMAELTEGDLTRTVHRKEGEGSAHDCDIPVREVFWHLVEEELQHRGEINALLWQIDVEAPVYDWIDWAHGAGRIRDSRSEQ